MDDLRPRPRHPQPRQDGEVRLTHGPARVMGSCMVLGLGATGLWVALEGTSRGSQLEDGWLFQIISAVLLTLIWRLTAAPAVHTHSDTVVIDQVTHRWTVPREAITDIVGRATLEVVTHERTISAQAFASSLISELTGNRRQVRAAWALRRWCSAGAASCGESSRREWVSVVPPLRDLAGFIVALQALYWIGFSLTA